MKFEGIYPPVITPYHDDFSIDERGFVTLLEHLAEAGVNGVVVGGTTGEYYAQDFDERVSLFKLAARTLAGRLPLIAGVGAIRTEDSIAYAQAARDCGADAILVSAPAYALPTQDELAEHALAIVGAADLPALLYNYPGRTGTMMRTAFFERIKGDAHFAAIKESSGDIEQMHTLARDYPNLALLCGADNQALEFFAWGARGWVCAGANCLPQEHIALYRAVALENDVAKGRALMSALLPLMTTLEQGGKLVQTVKHICHLRGLPAGPVRKPLGELDEREKQEIARVLEALDVSFAAESGIGT